MQINIAICDDENEICTQLEQILIEILKEKEVEYEIDVFYSGEGLCKEMLKMKYDLVFLDIELSKMNGIETGKYIREILTDERVQIAYISSKQEYAMELFDYRPINFLVKPLDKSKVNKVIKKYMVLFDQDNYMFIYKKGFKVFKILMSEILYFKAAGRKVTVVTKDTMDEFYETMETVYSRVKGYKFLFIHKATIVNYNYIVQFEYTQVKLVTNEVFSISQARRKNIRETYMEIKEEEDDE